MGNVRIVRRFLAIAMIAIKVSADSNTEASESQKLLRERRYRQKLFSLASCLHSEEDASLVG